MDTDKLESVAVVKGSGVSLYGATKPKIVVSTERSRQGNSVNYKTIYNFI